MDDMLLVDGSIMSLMVQSKTGDSVKCEVVDGGKLKSRRHLNVRGKSATLRWCLFFYLILNRTLILNSIKYYIVCFCSILFLLSIKK